MRLLIFVGMTIGGYVGWEVADRFGILIAFIVSGIGSILGVIGGWWLARRLFE